MKKITAFIVLSLLIISTAMNLFAAEIPDIERTGSVSVEMTYMGSPVAGGTLTAYRVADIKVENGADYSFSYLEGYAECDADISNLDDEDLAAYLASFTEENDISGTTLAIDEKGRAVFDNLELGLYVFVQDDAAKGYTKLGAFVVSVPQKNDDGYVYDVDATPKISTHIETVDTEPTTTTTATPTPPPASDDKLPQTGMLKWPIPILCVSGAMLVILGIYFLTDSKKSYGEN